jgi:hypothetical protein
MQRLVVLSLLILILGSSLTITGCGGAPDNSVSAPPETAPTAEELEAQYKSQTADYAAQQKEMQQRDQKR